MPQHYDKNPFLKQPAPATPGGGQGNPFLKTPAAAPAAAPEPPAPRLPWWQRLGQREARQTQGATEAVGGLATGLGESTVATGRGLAKSVQLAGVLQPQYAGLAPAAELVGEKLREQEHRLMVVPQTTTSRIGEVAGRMAGDLAQIGLTGAATGVTRAVPSVVGRLLHGASVSTPVAGVQALGGVESSSAQALGTLLDNETLLDIAADPGKRTMFEVAADLTLGVPFEALRLGRYIDEAAQFRPALKPAAEVPRRRPLAQIAEAEARVRGEPAEAVVPPPVEQPRISREQAVEEAYARYGPRGPERSPERFMEEMDRIVAEYGERRAVPRPAALPAEAGTVTPETMSTLAGAGVGAVAGGAIGAEQGHPLAGTAIGAAVGAGAVPLYRYAKRMGEAGKLELWHGSPHQFERFDLSKVGTGEGAQAYGHGLYFAERKSTAKFYAEMLGESVIRPTERMKQMLASVDNLGFDRQSDAIRAIARDANTDPDTWFEGWDLPSGFARSLEDEVEKSIIRRGEHVYKAAVDADPEDFLDWDKPIHQQSPKVQKVLRDMGLDFEDAVKDELTPEGWMTRPMTGREIYEDLADDLLERHRDIYVSRKLRQAGIKGVRYLDAMSRTAGEGTHNYVVFDDALISILEKGAITPETLSTLAGAGVGAAAGAMRDDEHPIRGALIGGTIGAGVVAGARAVSRIGKPKPVTVLTPEGVAPPERVTRQLKSWMVRKFRAGGELPDPVFNRMVERDGGINAWESELKFTLRDFSAAGKEAYGTANMKHWPRLAVRAVNETLHGKLGIEHLPDALQPVVRRMREQIDELSRRGMDAGAFEGPLELTVDENLGMYVTRSYQIFDDPDWTNKVKKQHPGLIEKAKAFIRREYPDLPENEIHGKINALLLRGEQADTPVAAIARGQKLGAKDLSITKRRKDIPPEIRALWGEYHDPILNYTRSVTKLANLVENQRFLNDVRTNGLGRFLFEKPTDTFAMKIAADESSAMAPLNGLYTTPEIERAFRDALERPEVSDFMRWYWTANGTVKYAKTVGSIQTHVRNFTANPAFLIANGNWRVTKGLDAVQAIAADVGITDSPKWRAYVQKLQRLGVIHESARAGELADVVRDATKRLDNPGDPWWVRAAKKTAKVATGAYRAEDDFWKVVAFENEFARYSKALSDVPVEDVERRVAEIVRNTLPTYSLVPAGIKWLRRFPLVGNFVSFPWEVYRTAGNSLNLAMKELADPQLKGIGAQRLAGLIVAATAGSVAAWSTRFLTGTDRQTDEDLRRFVAPWERNSDLIHLTRDPDGNFRYIDLSYTDVYAYFRSPIMAAMRGDDVEEALLGSLQELFQPFMDEEILAGKLMDIARNLDHESGRPVFNPHDSWDSKTEKVIVHLWDAVEPGTISSLERILAGMTNKVMPSGRTYDPATEIAATISGFRVQTRDIAQGLGFKVSRYSKNTQEARGILTETAARRGTVGDQELQQAYESSERAREELFKEIVEDVAAAQRLGVPRKQVVQILSASPLSSEQVQSILNNRYTPYIPTERFLENLPPEEGRRRRGVIGHGAVDRARKARKKP